MNSKLSSEIFSKETRCRAHYLYVKKTEIFSYKRRLVALRGLVQQLDKIGATPDLSLFVLLPDTRLGIKIFFGSDCYFRKPL